tara:strand:- start:277 stop:531 length:255 start_codon:yes stop_codon:yes gene_type:complete
MENSIHKQKHTADQQELHALHHRKAVAILQHLFFLFMYRLQAQARTGPGSLPRGSRKDLFFLFIYRLQAQASATQEAGPGALFY